MGAFGSCLGVGRPVKQGANPRLLQSTPVSQDANPFGHPGRPQAPHLMRTPNGIRANSYQGGGAGLPTKSKNPISKLVRQSSSLSAANQQAQSSPFNQGQIMVQPLVEIDDNLLASPFDKSNPQGSHLICNRKQPQSYTANSSSNAAQIGVPVENNTNSNLFMQSMRMNAKDNKVLIAMYDYDTRTPDDLAFRKGEHLESTLSLMTGDWWLAMSKSSKRIGYVPSNYVAELKSVGAEPWYFGKIGRVEAERLLRSPANRDGAFIIRDSDSNENRYSLSLRHGDEVKHYRVKQFETGGFYINQKTVFSTIHDLVQHYSNAPDGLCINLREPCVSSFEKPATGGLSHDTCDEWEIDRKILTLGKELGHGQFGQVFEGLFNGKTRVAIKTLRKGTMDPQDFLAEAQIMKKMRHKNLVQLYAVCTKEEPVYIVTELMSKGALVSYLQTDEGKNLPFAKYIEMATMIASGMSYIESEKYVHRDLAARNILVGENNVCKIADFGLARFIKETEYEARAGARFPIKWTAPEAANFSKFTIKSDVWSFGIVLYEIITKGATPYPDMSNAEVLNRIDKGYRMPQPRDCDTKYYGIMVDCWHKDPKRRPTFETLHWELENYFSSDSEQYKEASQFRDR